MTISVGEIAPGFVLPGTDGTAAGHRDYTLAEFAGRVVVLVFYPADKSPVCTMQLTTYSDDISRFGQVSAQVLAISPQGLADHDAFAADHDGFGFPLLADEHKAVGGAYGILGPLGFYRRSVFVIDAAGIVRYAHRSTAGLTFRSTDEIIDAVTALG